MASETGQNLGRAWANVEGAARALDKLLEHDDGEWLLGGMRVDAEAASELLSLHDYLRELHEARDQAAAAAEDIGQRVVAEVERNMGGRFSPADRGVVAEVVNEIAAAAGKLEAEPDEAREARGRFLAGTGVLTVAQIRAWAAEYGETVNDGEPADDVELMVSVRESSGALFERQRDEAWEVLRDLLDAADACYGNWRDWANTSSGSMRLRAALLVAEARLEGVEHTHALVELTDLARAVRTVRAHANLCEGASLTDEAASHRAFADRIEVRAPGDGSADTDVPRALRLVPVRSLQVAADYADFTAAEAAGGPDSVTATTARAWSEAFRAAAAQEHVGWPA